MDFYTGHLENRASLETKWATTRILFPVWCLGAIAVMAALTCAGCSKGNKPNTATLAPQKNTDIIDWIKTAVTGQRVHIEDLDSPSPGVYVVTLAGNTKSTTYTEEDALRSDSARVIGVIFGNATDDETPAHLTLIWTLLGPDSAKHSAMKIQITRATAKRWIWRRIYPADFPAAVDNYEYTPR